MSDDTSNAALAVGLASMRKMQRKTIIVGADEALEIAIEDAKREGRIGHANALRELSFNAQKFLNRRK